MQAYWGLDNTGCVTVQVNKGCMVQDLRGYLKHHSGNSHKIVRSGLAHIWWTTITLCVFFLFPLLFTYCKHETHTNTFTLLNCFHSQTSERSEVWYELNHSKFQLENYFLSYKIIFKGSQFKPPLPCDYFIYFRCHIVSFFF